MQISFTGAPEYMSTMLGFGNASWWMFESFKHYNMTPLIKHHNAQIGISFVPPHEYSFGAEHQYKIGYTPWESTGLQAGWLENMQACDEIWATNRWNKEIYESYLDKEVFVYNHGIDHRFSPKRRKYFSHQPFTFLYVGEPFNRKNGQLVYDTFTKLYGNDDRYKLVIKCTKMPDHPEHTIKVVEVPNSNHEPYYKNVIFITKMLSVEDLIDLYGSSHCFLYPSLGEGFGFNPFQAMAMGIPTICTAGWADYANYITLPLEAELGQSPWQDIHPGLQFIPSSAQFEEHMKNVVQNYDKYATIAFRNSFKLHEDYDWLTVTKPAIEKIKKIAKSRI